MNYNKGSMIQACNFIKKRLQRRCFMWLMRNFKNTYFEKCLETAVFEIYLVLLFWFLEDISEVAVCRRSTKGTYAGVFFQ